MNIYTYANGSMMAEEREVVREFPLVLQVNGREIATLVASPHDLRFLVAGFLRLQGFVTSLDDFHLLSVCDDYGIANVRIKGELPERLKPILTSGCGTGITFSLPGGGGRVKAAPGAEPVTPAAISRLMEELAKRAEGYKSHGGIHSAAVGEGDGTLLLYAEDLGRHNTLDRIAGEALLKGIDLEGKMLVTSGRVSTEMAGKAACLGLSVIASRTSPTDMAVTMAEEAGITLLGYVRGGRFDVYAHPQGVSLQKSPAGEMSATVQGVVPEKAREARGRFGTVTGVILAGGQSSRMGSNKALLPYRGGRFIEAIHRQLSALFDDVIIVTNNPEQYGFLECRTVPDLFPGMGALAGLHAGLAHSRTPYVFAVACDMPYLLDGLIARMAAMADGLTDVVIAESGQGVEPLHALYSRRCLDPMARSLAAGKRRIMDFFPEVRVQRLPAEEVVLLDPEGRSFSNINTPSDYFALRGEERHALSSAVGERPGVVRLVR
jgi:FdhD protein